SLARLALRPASLSNSGSGSVLVPPAGARSLAESPDKTVAAPAAVASKAPQGFNAEPAVSVTGTASLSGVTGLPAAGSALPSTTESSQELPSNGASALLTPSGGTTAVDPGLSASAASTTSPTAPAAPHTMARPPLTPGTTRPLEAGPTTDILTPYQRIAAGA